MRKIISYILALFVASTIPVSTVCAEGLNVSGDGTSVIEAENVSLQYASTRNSDEASGTKYMVFDCGTAAANQRFNLNVEETGYYSLDVIAGAYGANNVYSSVSVQVNEEAVKDLSGSDIDGSKGGFTGYAGLPLNYFKVYDKVYLSEGENSVKITIGERPGVASYILAQFDAFIINPYVDDTPEPDPTPDTQIPVINGDNYLIEAETQISGYTIVDNEYASGGKVVRFDGTKSDDVSVEYLFDVEEDGEYVLSFLAANTLTNKWSSVMSFGIGEDTVEMSESNFTVSSPENSYINNDYPVKILRYNKAVNLTSGRNSIVVNIKLRSGGDVAAVLDAISIQKQKDISGGISVEDIVIKEGENADIILKNALGERLYDHDADSIVIEASEYGIAQIDGLKVVAYNRGETQITVTITKDNVVKTAKGNIIVVGDSGIYFDEITKDAGTLTAKIGAIEDYAGGDYVLVAVYGFDGRVQTSLKGALNVSSIPAIAEGNVYDITVPIENVADGDIIVAYITDMTYTKSLYGKSIIK